MLNKELVTQLSSKNEEPNWLLEQRLKAFGQFLKEPAPLFKYGIGIFLDTSELKLDNIEPLNENILEVTCNDKRIEILNLKQALKNHEQLVKKYLFSLIKDEKISTLHKAFFGKTIFVRIPQNVNAEKSININFFLKSSTSLDSILIIAESNSKATVIEHSSSMMTDFSLEKSAINKTGFRSQVVEIIAKENAKIEYISVQNLSQSIHNFSKRLANLEKDAYVYWLDCILGSKFTQSVTTTKLNGIGASSKNLGIFLGDKNQRFDINVETIHEEPKTQCDMYTKGVLNDNAKNVYRGLVKIQPNAYQSKGFQKSDTLLLGENTETDPVPVLEINNNDVKCGHGATVGQIDKEKIFYMMSRGLTEDQAIETIIKGFFDPVLNQLSGELAEELRTAINERIEGGLRKSVEIEV